jgi:hypothetical protein
MTQNTLKLVYHSYFNSLTNYGITFFFFSSYINSTFKLLNMIIRIILGIGIKDSCIFQNIKYFTTEITIYIFFLVLFMVKNKNKFRINSEIHSINTRNNSNFHQLLSLLAIYHKCPQYMGIKIYNNLAPKI